MDTAGMTEEDLQEHADFLQKIINQMLAPEGRDWSVGDINNVLRYLSAHKDGKGRNSRDIFENLGIPIWTADEIMAHLSTVGLVDDK